MSVHLARPFTFAFTLEDYRQMFDLTDQELVSAVLDYPAGFSSFNAEMHQLGRRVVSADPCYQLTPEAMQAHIAKQLDGLQQHFDQHQQTLSESRTLQAFIDESTTAAQLFSSDYAEGQQQQRYQAMRMPGLPFEHHQFDLALSSHWLFSDHPDSFYQMQTMREMIRVAGECRIFPVLDVNGEMSPSLGPLMIQLQQENLGVEVREVPFSLQKEGNAMLRVWAKECKVD